MDWDIIEHYRNMAVNTYSVDPVIFVVLVVLSTPFYYYTLFVMGELILKLRRKHKLNGAEVMKHPEFIRAFIINSIAWLLPNIYVLVWGENLPKWLLALIIINIFLTFYLFYSKIFSHLKVKV